MLLITCQRKVLFDRRPLASPQSLLSSLYLSIFQDHSPGVLGQVSCSDLMLQIGCPQFLARGDSVEKSLCVPRGLSLAGAAPVGVGGGMDSGS